MKCPKKDSNAKIISMISQSALKFYQYSMRYFPLNFINPECIVAI